jgi:hypothetical protein
VIDEDNMKLDLVLVEFHNDIPYKSLKIRIKSSDERRFCVTYNLSNIDHHEF